MFSYKQLSLCLSFIFTVKHFVADLSNKRQSHFSVIFPSTGCSGGSRRETDSIGNNTLIIIIWMSLKAIIYRYLVIVTLLAATRQKSNFCWIGQFKYNVMFCFGNYTQLIYISCMKANKGRLGFIQPRDIFCPGCLVFIVKGHSQSADLRQSQTPYLALLMEVKSNFCIRPTDLDLFQNVKDSSLAHPTPFHGVS